MDLHKERIKFEDKTKGFKAYEFTTAECLELEFGSYDLFRLEIWKNGQIAILVANQDDFFVHDDVTEHFNCIEIISECIQLDENFEDMTDEYQQFLEEYAGPNMIIREMWLIHNWLYASKEEADKYNDGKDKPDLFYCLMDASEYKPNMSPDNVYLANSMEEAEKEMEYSK